MDLLQSDSIEFTIRQKWYGPVIYVRTTYMDNCDDYVFGAWRKANDSERNAALLKLMELNK